jgi:hypothetical protein
MQLAGGTFNPPTFGIRIGLDALIASRAGELEFAHR